MLGLYYLCVLIKLQLNPMMNLLNHIELKHKTKLQKSHGGTNCVPQVHQSNIELCQS